MSDSRSFSCAHTPRNAWLEACGIHNGLPGTLEWSQNWRVPLMKLIRYHMTEMKAANHKNEIHKSLPAELLVVTRLQLPG